MGDKFVMSRIHRGSIDCDRSFLREFFPSNFSKRIYSRHATFVGWPFFDIAFRLW